jgi:hypothetical protein|tara:strand:+ start:407 stop:700 length:294 start_codon:yes stop_codon:yes gene_type:complete
MSEENNTFEVQEIHTTIKEYNHSDLPVYFKWESGSKPWYHRVRLVEGKIISDVLKETYDGWEYTYSTITSAFSSLNTPIDEDEWRNVMHNFQIQLKK